MQKQTFSLLVFHGSNRQQANTEAFNFIKTLAGKQQAKNFGCCFLRGSQPTIEQALDQAKLEGKNTIRVIPLFLLPGSHINEDIPAAIKLFSEANPEVKITVNPCLCQCPEFADLIAGQIENE